MALLLPSITRRLDDILLVKELNAKFFDHCISEQLLHTAISTPSASIEFDYERLELLGKSSVRVSVYQCPKTQLFSLGDAYLKYLSSIYLFVTNPTQHEGALHIARQRIISNRSLLKNADRSGLPQYIQSKPFTSKSWIPHNFRVFHPPKPISPNDVSNEHPISIADADVVMGDLEGNNTLREDPTISQLNTISNNNTIPEDADASNGTSAIGTSQNDSMPNADKSVEVQRPEAIDAQAPPFTSKKAKRAQEDANVQWLGDKVIDQTAYKCS